MKIPANKERKYFVLRKYKLGIYVLYGQAVIFPELFYIALSICRCQTVTRALRRCLT